MSNGVNSQKEIISNHEINSDSEEGEARLCNHHGKIRKVAEVVFLSVIVMMLLGLYMIPTVYYLRPPLESIPVSWYNNYY